MRTDNRPNRSFVHLACLALLLLPLNCGPLAFDEPVFADEDGDGFVRPEDCDDNDATVHPNATELCDGLDNDCDTSVDEGFAQVHYLDSDGDSYGNPRESVSTCVPHPGEVSNDLDCDDSDPEISPDAEETCNGIDDDCDEKIDEGFDRDADGVTVCAGDCDDEDPTVYEYAEEICDGKDNNCDDELSTEEDETDADGDGSPNCGDCAPDDPDVYPEALELCDGVDNNCNGEIDEGVSITYCPDEDLDGHGDGDQITRECEQPPPDYIDTCDDCDDEDPLVYPSAEEMCNELDDNCDGVPGADELDGDGDGYSECDGDCDDTSTDISPDATDTCDDGIDQDCSGEEELCPDEDNDGDGVTENQGDCDDSDPNIYPDADEACGNGIDNDCDGSVDEDGISDDEPNDSIDDAVNLGTLDDEDGFEACVSFQGQLASDEDEDYFKFHSEDQWWDDWKISVVLIPPDDLLYCVEIIKETGEVFSSAVCDIGPAQVVNQVEFVPENATGDYWIRIYSGGSSECVAYSVTACAY